MTTYSAKALRFLITCIWALLPLYAYCASDGADSIYLNAELTEVKVSSVKTNKHNLTPVSVSLVGPAVFRTQQLSDVSDLSGVLPNFFVPEYGSKQTTPIAIRGIMSKIKATAVGFYIDGVPHYEISSFDSDLLDVKAIEVFRGPQGTLYGRNTFGGVINVYTYSPFEYHGTKVRIGGGNYGNFNLQLSNYTKLSDRFGFYAGGYYKHKGGYFENVYLNKNADKSDEAGAKVGLFWRSGNGVTFRLTSNCDYVNQGGYPYAPYDAEAKSLKPVSYNRECGFNRLLSTNGFALNYIGESFSVNSQTTFQYYDEGVKMDQDYSSADNYFIHLDASQYVLSEELTFKSEGDGRFQWIAGLFFFHQNYDYCSDTWQIQRNYNSVNDYQKPTTSSALFAQASYNLFSGLSATVGLRFDHEVCSVDYCSYNLSDGVKTIKSDFDSQMTNNDVMPKFGLQYKWNRNVVFANVTRGCKAGGFNSVFESDSERSYDDEYNWNYEVGVKATRHDNKIGGELTLFYIDWRNQHISRTIPGLGNIIYNAGHSDSKGIEASINARPVTGLSLQANYGFTYARFIDYRKSDSADFSGNMIPLVPRNTMALLASYSFAPARLFDMMTFSVNLNGVGKLYWLEDNNVVQPFYSQLGAKIAVQKGFATLELWGRNLTNTDYLSYYFTSSSAFAQGGVPMTFGSTLSLSF